MACSAQLRRRGGWVWRLSRLRLRVSPAREEPPRFQRLVAKSARLVVTNVNCRYCTRCDTCQAAAHLPTLSPLLVPAGVSMPISTARTLKGPRRFIRRAGHRNQNPRLQFLRGFLKHPVMVGSIIPSSRIVIEKMLGPVDWEKTKLFVEYGPGVGTFTRPILEKLGPDATLLTIDTNPEFTKFLKESIDEFAPATAIASPLALMRH